jgi:hypothetical protein
VSFVANAKSLVRHLLPDALIRAYRRRKRDAFERRYTQPSEAFDAIYRHRIWGESGGDRFYSGIGSHVPEIVDRYVEAVEAFIATLPTPPRVVDLGCGDFNVGRRVRAQCAHYVACDIVQQLIEHNRAAYPGVDFRCLDISADPLPEGDVAFVRQVLQHLSNAHIATVVPKLSRYRHVLVTEHLPEGEFEPNLDKPTGFDVRLDRTPRSGVVLTRPPFDFRPLAEHVLCEVRGFGGVIRTVAYTTR